MQSNVTGHKELLKSTSLSVAPFIKTGAFIGKIADFNVWNKFLSASEIEKFSKGCIGNPNLSFLVNWEEANISGLTGKVGSRLVNRAEVCSKSTGTMKAA